MTDLPETTSADALKWVRSELIALCEATEDDPGLVRLVASDTEGKMGAYARGRISEAKGIRRAMAEVIDAKLLEVCNAGS